MIGSLVGSVLLGGLGKVLGFFNERSRIQMYAQRDKLQHRYQMQRAEYEYKVGRLEQIAAIQGQEPFWSNVVRIVFAAPVAMTYVFEFMYWWLIGEWYPVQHMGVDDAGNLVLREGYPPHIQYLVYAVIGFYFAYEGTMQVSRLNTRKAIVLDPKNQELIEAAGQERKRRFHERHGPKGQ